MLQCRQCHRGLPNCKLSNIFVRVREALGAQLYVFYVSGRLWEAHLYMFYVSWRLWELDLYVFYEVLRPPRFERPGCRGVILAGIGAQPSRGKS